MYSPTEAIFHGWFAAAGRVDEHTIIANEPFVAPAPAHSQRKLTMFNLDGRHQVLHGPLLCSGAANTSHRRSPLLEKIQRRISFDGRCNFDSDRESAQPQSAVAYLNTYLRPAIYSRSGGNLQRDPMKDGILLTLAAAGCSFGAWFFWHVLASDALTVLMILAFISMAVHNIRLRKKLRAKQSEQQ